MKKYSYALISGFLFLAFIVFTIIVKTVDVTFISTNGTYLGLSHFNYEVGNYVISLNKMKDMKVMSDILLYISLAFCLVFVAVGIIQLIKGKSLKAVDKRIYLLGACYVLVVLIYLIFEIAKINYSPISDKGFKASYPSTHVFVGSTLLLVNTYTAVKMLKIGSNLFKAIIYTSSAVICLLIAFTRLLSLYHWASDIIASVMLILAVYFIFLFAYKRIEDKEQA